MENINAVLWGPFTVCLILFCGIYHTVKSRFIQLRLWRHLGGNGRNSAKAVSSALAASMGTGNITGCAAAISAGGIGAVFWMWVSAFLGMALAYSENRLGGEFSEKYHSSSGPMLYIEKGLGSKKTALVYAAACLCAALAMGCMSQTAAFSEAVWEQGIMSKQAAGIFAAIAAAAVIFSSEKASDAAMNAAEKLVPVMGLLYAGGCIILVIFTGCNVFAMTGEIVREAFSAKAAAGGIFGAAVSKAVSVGLRRGIFSNEAGMGSSVLVHSGAGFSSPENMGAWAAFEVFLDTIVCCTLTAFALISSGRDSLSEAFSICFGKWGGGFVCLCVCLFALASVLGWCCYGEKCLEYLTGGKAPVNAYKIVFCLCGAVAGYISLDLLFGLSDMINVFLIFPNLIAVTYLTMRER